MESPFVQFAGQRSQGRESFRGRGRGRSRQTFNKATVECYNCHKLGHFQWECQSNTRRGRQTFNKATMECYNCHKLDIFNGNVKARRRRQTMQRLKKRCRWWLTWTWIRPMEKICGSLTRDVAIICVGRRNIFQILMKVSEIQWSWATTQAWL